MDKRLVEIRAIQIVERHLYRWFPDFEVHDVSAERKRGCDFWLVDLKKPTVTRYIEVKGMGTIGNIKLTLSEYEAAEKYRSRYWLYVVAGIKDIPVLYCIPNPLKTIRNGQKVGWNFNSVLFEAGDWMAAARERTLLSD
jgi:hypothetical protein